MSAGVLRGMYQRPGCLAPRPRLGSARLLSYERYASTVLQVLTVKCCCTSGKMRNGGIKRRLEGEGGMVSKSNQPLCLLPVERRNVQYIRECVRKVRIFSVFTSTNVSSINSKSVPVHAADASYGSH